MLANRQSAGRELAKGLAGFKNKPKTIIVGLLRGGLAVAFEISHALQLPLYGLVCRKITPLENPEFALGGICNGKVSSSSELPVSLIDSAKIEITKYRKALPELVAPKFHNQTVIIVDDGMATGWTMAAACKLAKEHGANKIIAAVPVASKEAVELIKPLASKVVVLANPEPFFAVGQFYLEFEQVTFAKVRKFLMNRKN